MKPFIHRYSSLYSYFVIAILLLLVSSLILPHQIIKAQNATSSNQSAAQLMSKYMKVVSGRYVNPSTGLQVDLPQGWKGVDITFPTFGGVRIAPLGTDPFGRGAVFPPIFIGFASLNDTQGLANRVIGYSPYFNASNPTAGCKISSPSPVKINGMDAIQRVRDCAPGTYSQSQKPEKATWYTFATHNKVIDIIFSDNTIASYDNHQPQFQTFLNTLKIAGAVNPMTVLKNR